MPDSENLNRDLMPEQPSEESAPEAPPPSTPPAAAPESPSATLSLEAPLPTEAPPEPPRRRSGGGCLLIAVLILLACAVLSIALAVGGALVGVTRMASPLDISGSLASATQTISQTYQVGSGPRLVLRSSNGRALVRGVEGNTIAVEATKRAVGPNAQARLQDIEVSTTQDGDTVAVEDRRLSPPRPLDSGGVTVDYVVTAPPGTVVDVRSGNGAVVVEAIRGGVTIDAGNGRVAVTRPQGRVDVTANNGSIDVQDANVDSMTLQAGNGDVSFSGLLGEGASEIRSGNGAVKVALPKDQRVRLDVQTGQGRITNNLSSDQPNGRSLRAALNGGGGTLLVRVGNGSVTLDSR
ncbi:MAG: DUF4097 family beta strand repeat-containing protein [Anaerolineae bacterium]